MYSEMKNNFKWIMATLILALFGCASIEHKIELLSLGATTNEVEEILKNTKYTVVERKIEPDGTIEVRRYSSYSNSWDLTFKDRRLVGWEKVPPAYYANPRVGVGFGFEGVIVKH
ncbi:MAG TPA: hypothetical protein VI387_04255 [Candidatus Brocadiales bacterium]|nr:hypothetical protein [Candidatus Brocadiales bacterium]